MQSQSEIDLTIINENLKKQKIIDYNVHIGQQKNFTGADTGKKFPQIFRFPDFIQCLPDFLQRYPDFSLKKFFKVCKCERCGSLNPLLL